VKYAIFSDIHSNLEALAAVLKDARERRVDAYICLGDIVGIGASPIECIEILRNMNVSVVHGDYDLEVCDQGSQVKTSNRIQETLVWTRNQVSGSDIDWIRSHRREGSEKHFRYVHASLNQIAPWQRLIAPMDASEHFDFQRESLCFVGHSHLQKIFQLDAISEELPFQNVIPNKKVKTVVSVGSVGRPQDNISDAAYVIYDSNQNILWPLRVPYDVRSAQLKMKSAGFDIELIRSLAVGR
tara:strand:+ start:536 stop:1258 length:723 start_codon:yes stop_codon:yes gene_type:complete